MNIKQKKELAKLLYVSGACKTQKELAERVDVSPITMSKWVRAGNWEEQKRSLITIRNEQLGRLYRLLEWYTNGLEGQMEAQEEGAKPHLNTKDTDVIIKLTGAIKNLEIELSVAEVVDVFMKYNKYIRKTAPERIKEEADLQDGFVKTLL